LIGDLTLLCNDFVGGTYLKGEPKRVEDLHLLIEFLATWELDNPRDVAYALTRVVRMIKTYLPGDILTKVDRASMANSLEVRAPFLDHRFVEWSATLPASSKLHDGEGKYVLKKSLESRLPENVLYRPKQGFSVPLAQWFRAELRDLTYETIFSSNDGILDLAYLRKVWQQHQKGVYDRSAHLWAVLMFRKWQQTFQA